MSIEFTSKGRLADSWICFKNDFRRSMRKTYRKLRGLEKPPEFKIRQRFSEGYAKKVIIKKKLALDPQGKPSWFYTAFEREDKDALTNYTLSFIENNISKDSGILVTGCGTGITVFHLADCGFKKVVGIDLLPQCIQVANELKEKFNYDNTFFYAEDGFHPRLEEKFDVITALHWVFSAWMGNYGNVPNANPFDIHEREKVLNEFFQAYARLLNPGGMLIIELIDAVADYRLPADHYMGDYSKNIYPIRHTPEQVVKCAHANGLEVVDKKLSVSYGHQPRTSYFLRLKS